ncbi:hypothetical protein M758_6G150200 [Ceratodon purpureus]|nr:hypothetical protein M758_6G150200 [Ceratodon purpureus]
MMQAVVCEPRPLHDSKSQLNHAHCRGVGGEDTLTQICSERRRMFRGRHNAFFGITASQCTYLAVQFQRA